MWIKANDGSLINLAHVQKISLRENKLYQSTGLVLKLADGDKIIIRMASYDEANAILDDLTRKLTAAKE